MKNLRLYSYWRSSASWRVRIGLNLKGLKYEYVAVHLLQDGGQQHADSYRALNPMRTVPTLEWTHTDGTVRRLSQSLAILDLLEATCPSPALLPKDPYLAGKARMLAEMVNSGVQPLVNLSVLQRIKSELKADEKAWAAYWIGRGLEAVEAAVKPLAGRYCIGDEVSLADICVVPQLYGARRFGVDLGAYPTVVRIEAACNELPAFQAAHPDRQPDVGPA